MHFLLSDLIILIRRMSFSEAVRGFCSTPSKLHIIQSAWETEFGEKMTEVDAARFSKYFTVEDTYKNIKKVSFVKFMLISKSILCVVWIWIN